jgi:hypothetical protein
MEKQNYWFLATAIYDIVKAIVTAIDFYQFYPPNDVTLESRVLLILLQLNYTLDFKNHL